MDDNQPDLHHRPYEDLLALLTGGLFVAMGVQLFGHVGLLTGGTAGIAFLVHYATGWNFGLVFFVINLPFYGLAWKRMGRAFTVKTFAAVGTLALLNNLLPHVLELGHVNTLFATLAGGSMIGAGMLILFRHRASLGGFNVLVLYLQDRYGWRAGILQMGLDSCIVLAAFAVTDTYHIGLSVLGAVVLNQTLATNHRAGRYMAL